MDAITIIGLICFILIVVCMVETMVREIEKRYLSEYMMILGMSTVIGVLCILYGIVMFLLTKI